jgi:hypothetical protein
MRRRFSFALLLVLDVGIQLQADRDQLPADRRSGPLHIGSIRPRRPIAGSAAPRPARGSRRRSMGHVSDKQYISISYQP